MGLIPPGRALLSTAFAIAFAFASWVVLLAPAGANAAVGCTFASGVLDVDVTAGTETVVGLQRSGSEIEVWEGFVGSGTEVCPLGQTVSNTNSIQIDDLAVGQSTTFHIPLANGRFEPGLTAEGSGSSEIEVTLNGNEGFADQLTLTGSDLNENWRLGDLGAGASGANLNAPETAGPDVDDLKLTGIENLVAFGDPFPPPAIPSDDTIDASGGTGFTGPLPLTGSTLSLVGDTGDDALTAGTGNTNLDGTGGNDTLIGGPGNDTLRVSFGDDTADGSGGTDTCSYLNANFPVSVDLAISTPQAVGGGETDTISDCESLVGGDLGDTLTGTSGPNNLNGGENSVGEQGADTLRGLAGNDILQGSSGDDVLIGGADNDTYGSIGSADDGADTVSYAEGSTGPISISLLPGLAGVAQPTGGAGTDTFIDGVDPGTEPDVESITGSPFGDTLTGNDLRNHVVGGSGSDTISLLGEQDTFDVFNNDGDSVDCGSGTLDAGVADEPSVDTPVVDCETTDFVPDTSVDSGPADGSSTNLISPVYGLSSTEADVSFALSIDGGPYQPCSAQCEAGPLSSGQHTLRFRATENAGLARVEPNPVTRIVTFTPPDTLAPDTQLTKSPKAKLKSKKKTAKASFGFTSTEPGSRFECRLDKAPFGPCTSPLTLKVKRGRHSFEVIAIDAAGNRDPSAATVRFKVVRKKKRR